MSLNKAIIRLHLSEEEIAAYKDCARIAQVIADFLHEYGSDQEGGALEVKDAICLRLRELNPNIAIGTETPQGGYNVAVS